MASRSFELESVDLLAAAAQGEPGQRRFFLVARSGAETMTLACEKFHVQGLVTRARQLLEERELAEEKEVTAVSDPPLGEPDWAVGELGLGYHDSRRRFVIVAREVQPEAEGEIEGESEDPPASLLEPGELDEPASGTESEAATARVWVTPEQVRNFVEQAELVLAAGRPTCQYCGLPIDPAGHPCPASNGSRPVF